MSAPEITADELREWMEDGEALTIVDVRDSASYAAGHIPGSLSNPADGFDAEMFKGVPADRRIVISCYHGMMSRQVVDYLVSLGFSNAYSLKGGWAGWK